MIDIRQPHIQGSEKEQVSQMRTYLFQLVEQLQYAFQNIGENSNKNSGATQIIQQNNVQTITRPPTEEEAEQTFAAIKALIIKSGDIIDSYYEDISGRLESVYVAQSDFGTYKSEVTADMEANAENIKINQQKVETISSAFKTEDTYALVVSNTGYIKTGFLGDNEYGIEIGQDLSNGEMTVTRGTLRITPQKISFIDSNGIEVAWLEQQTFHANVMEAVVKQRIGGFIEEVDPETQDVTTRWIPKEGV